MTLREREADVERLERSEPFRPDNPTTHWTEYARKNQGGEPSIIHTVSFTRGPDFTTRPEDRP